MSWYVLADNLTTTSSWHNSAFSYHAGGTICPHVSSIKNSFDWRNYVVIVLCEQFLWDTDEKSSKQNTTFSILYLDEIIIEAAGATN